MDSMKAFAMGEANRGKEMMVFDWDKAAKLLKESGVSRAAAGLCGDWEYTGDSILFDGKIPEEKTWTYLASTWAAPELEYNGETIPCYKMASEVPDWDAETFWPDSARKIFEA